ncbi:glycerol dehydratase reactivase beta/small subunit family protein [Ligilactobacillus pobuzihii]|uniref:Uncharacterized protein n=1 Tax=Ligilactobacillus pobuzihii TaxID=449659 RepID=A0A0R2LHC2_9LACO|nr:glycerol dehydratase reactivase beta/small subunit family protein [Ligilactobacillus pobuzihii]KRO01199.1 hypothetical protein IV66_GL000732 [Ligilactobacillus pobuzihii]GEN49245.1 propanediol dehydratase reactivation protein [Ligilactobacillus pobuzihii]
MINNSEKPAILLACKSDKESYCTADLKEILYGIEEEQIPYVLTTAEEEDATNRAYDAALRSRLNVGLAYDQRNVIVHYKNLAQDQPLFVVNRNKGYAALRQLGNNAARLVKGVPFKNGYK